MMPIWCKALLLLTATFVAVATIGDSCGKLIFGSASFIVDTLAFSH